MLFISKKISLYLLGCVLSATAYADEKSVQGSHSLIVVHTGTQLISARPYYHKIGKKTGERARALAQLGSSAVLLAADRNAKASFSGVSGQDFLPLVSHQMQPGTPEHRVVDGLYQAFFMIGMDSASLTWLRQHYQDLARIGASGMVVQADDWAQWEALHREALGQGVALGLMPADGVARSYGFTHYPVLVTGSNWSLGDE